jgi:competence protein ComEC
MRQAFLAAFVASTLLPALAEADYLRASRTAHIYVEADRSSDKLGTLGEGDEVALARSEKKDGYYEVRLVNGNTGFVYKSLVRRFEGDLMPSDGPDGNTGGGNTGTPTPPAPPPPPRISAERITLARQLARPVLRAGEYRVYMFDVGTGLSLLVQGSDFNMLFDGGTRDDRVSINRNEGTASRVLAYLWATVGPSGGPECIPEGESFEPVEAPETRTIHHLVLSHGHQDHASDLDEVLQCYQVEHVWEPGIVNDAVFYERFVSAVANEAGVHYHTARSPAEDHIVTVSGRDIELPAATWTSFGEGTHQVLGFAATFDVLFADGVRHSDFNQNSLVLRVELGDKSLLLTGDAEAGQGRGFPSDPAGEAEGALLDRHPSAIDVDILQVGHHGSRTSSRTSFLQAVSPEWALLSSGPTAYSSVVLPDQEVVTALQGVLGDRAVLGLLRTDAHDRRVLGAGAAGACEDVEKIGSDADGRAGGCDAWLLEIR